MWCTPFGDQYYRPAEKSRVCAVWRNLEAEGSLNVKTEEKRRVVVVLQDKERRCRSGIAFLKPTAIEVRGIIMLMHARAYFIYTRGVSMNMVIKKSFTVNHLVCRL